MNGKPEILAPVGNEEMLVAAVRCGADAVYLGAKEFSARRNAENFDDEQLKNAIKYCRIRGVKVYLTLNIIIKDEELPAAVDLAIRAYNYGIDGIIIADLGLAGVLRRLVPDLPLHASTQMSVNSVPALKILKQMGFTRVVAAREMSENDLKIFCKEAEKLGIETEVFVHGALCMSVSGQCLLSAFWGSRSGNRGLCAGPCRLPFKVKGGTGHDLSLKDLSLLPHLKKLEQMGVNSFKIEGRMKRPEYVAAAVSAAVEALGNGSVNRETDEILKNVFSRSGFTDGYFTEKTGKDMFGVRTKEDVEGTAKAFPQIHGLYRKENGRVKISALLIARSGKPLTLSLSDGENTVFAEGEVPGLAQKKAATVTGLKEGLDKFGSTPYIPEISVTADDGLYISNSSLNELRRKATEKLDKCRAEIKREQVSAVYSPSVSQRNKGENKLYIRVENQAQIPDGNDFDGIIFPLEEEFCSQFSGEKVADIPRGITDEEYIKSRLELFAKKGFTAAVCDSLSAVEIAKSAGFEIIGGTGLNIINGASADVLYNMGAKRTVLSDEITLKDARKLDGAIKKGIIVYGNIPLMLFKNCPLKNGGACKNCRKEGVITDRMGVDFPVRCRGRYSELLNSVPLWLADKPADTSFADFKILYFTRETPERVKEVINAFKNCRAADCKFTYGLFYRGSI